MGSDSDVDKKIETIGQQLYSQITGVPPLFDTGTWTGRVMAWAMKNEDFKNRLFRFVDVLPSLQTDELVVSVLRQYFSENGEVPKVVSRGIDLIPEKGLVTHIAGPLIRKSIASIARQFIVPNSSRHVIKAVKALRSDETLLSVDVLGEVVVSEKEARKYREQYLRVLELLNVILPGEPRRDISLKASSFYSQLDPVDWEGSIDRTKEALHPLLHKAAQLSISVTIDMEHYYLKGLIIAIFKRIIEEDEANKFPWLGIALQTYLEETEQDAVGLIRWARERKRKIAIRLVKGAYWDYEVVINRQREWPVPVFLNKEETDRSFESITKLLLENSDIVYPAIATHNVRSIAHAIAVADSLSLSKQDFEFQMLYGMAEPLRRAVRKQGFTVRVYTPVGKLIPGMAYLVRRLLENTSNTSFLRRSFSENRSFEELIKPPLPQEHTIKNKSIDIFRNEPLLDFSIAENRRKMTGAITAIKNQTAKTYPLLIGEQTVQTDRQILSRNPASPDQIVGRVSSASQKEADAAIDQALAAGKKWRGTEPENRAAYLFKAAEEMRRQRVELAALEVIEVGKTWKDADADVAEGIDYLEYYGREILRLGRPKRMGDYAGEENDYYYVPKGTGAVIAPWNFPLAIATGMTSAAIAAGNCVIFKPSGLSPVIGYKLCDIFRSAALPSGVLQFLPGPGSEVGEYLVSHPAIDFIAFTGSKDVGLRIIRLAGETGRGQRNIKKVIAELGGKNAVIVDETADLDEAVKAVLESAFGYQGQRCSACSRLIAVADVFNELRERLVEAVSSLRIGPTEDPGNSLGPVIDLPALEKIRNYIEIGKREGKLVLEREVPVQGYFASPAIFIDAPHDSRIATEEIFGPVLTMIRAKHIDDAIELANRSQYALTGGLFSRSPANIQKVKKEFLTGNLYINRKITGALVGRQPFGGFGMSGVGSKAGGPDYLLQFMNPVSVTENTIRRGFARLE